MHIHGSQMNPYSASLYSSAGAEKAAEAQRAADVRKKLMKSASDIEGVPSPDETFLVGQWMDSRHSQVLSGDEYHAAATGKDPDFG
jgi:DNA phosphorothioation-dependent restriction protein DptG